MEVPSLGVFSRQLRRQSSASTFNRTRQRLHTYETQLNNTQHTTLNPFVASTLDELGRCRIGDSALWGCRKCEGSQERSELQQQLNQSYGYTFAHLSKDLKKSLYRSGDPNHPCLIHDHRSQKHRDTGLQRSPENCLMKLKHTQSYTVPYQPSRPSEQVPQENLDPNLSYTLSLSHPRSHSHSRNTQTTQTLKFKGLGSTPSGNAQFNRKLKRLFSQAENCHSKLQKLSLTKAPPINMEPFMSLQNENCDSVKECIQSISSLISKAETGELKEEEPSSSFFS